MGKIQNPPLNLCQLNSYSSISGRKFEEY